jgi:hypothetical protein
MPKTFVRDVGLYLSRSAGNRPPYLSGEENGVIRLSTTKREEVRLAQEELDRWQDAFDRNDRGDPDRYHTEIRFAERRLRSAISSANCRAEAVPPPIIARGLT